MIQRALRVVVDEIETAILGDGEREEIGLFEKDFVAGCIWQCSQKTVVNGRDQFGFSGRSVLLTYSLAAWRAMGEMSTARVSSPKVDAINITSYP